MIKKRLMALTLAAAMTLSVGTAAFAADTTVDAPDSETGAYKADVTVDSEVKVPTIKITVPGSTKVAINPYKMEYELEDSTTVTDALANPVQYIKNESDVAIAVSTTTSALAAEGSDVVLSTSALKGTETTKSVFAYLELKTAADTSSAVEFSTEYNSKATDQIVFGTKATTKTKMLTLDAGDSSPTYAAYKVLGQVASNPAKAWTESDKLNMSLTFNFAPVVATE